ncbi:MAG TPA: DegT/DnrJ/EryC1/StrS family aminotransferase [Vicinamibacterales bacterium]|jgi:dTDP-4-amino-4,6-dideoxygalactose transaminase|nr:DegT/DnrJ/EryC1/StrS family aminotransferase [Vicinamibacterales bacterium]
MAKLAINGGRPVREQPFPEYVTIGEEEKRAVAAVLDSTVLSKYLGTWSPEFYGGPRVQTLEREWADYFGVSHAVTVNSATSGLYAAVGASGAGPGDEVIVSPYSMSASATAALVYGAIPVFADIDPQTFCLSPRSICERITPLTKAIIAVDLFGHPADFDEIVRIARERKIVVIEDAAQAPGALLNGRYAGTLADIGVFSLNYHKTIHTGEGGVVVTNDDDLADRVQLIRNHGEVVVKAKGTKDITNLIGFNYRMTEIEAAIGSEQLKKLERLLTPRIEAADYLTEHLRALPGLTPAVVRPGVRHAYYVYALRYDAAATGVPRSRFAAALKAEGLPIGEGYVEPIYLEPVYQRRIAFGRDGFPFTYPGYKGRVRYDRGICPVTERMHDSEMLLTAICHAGTMRRDLEDFVAGCAKVSDNLAELR